MTYTLKGENEMDDEEHGTPPISSAVFTLREALLGLRQLNVEEDRIMRRRAVLYNHVELALGIVVQHFHDMPDPPSREFPELNNKDGE